MFSFSRFFLRKDTCWIFGLRAILVWCAAAGMLPVLHAASYPQQKIAITLDPLLEKADVKAQLDLNVSTTYYINKNVENLQLVPGYEKFNLLVRLHNDYKVIQVQPNIPDPSVSVVEISYTLNSEANIDSNALIINSQGVYLPPRQLWYPRSEFKFPHLEINVLLPDSWHSMTSGDLTQTLSGTQTQEVWNIDFPSEPVFLIAGQFEIGEEVYKGIKLQTYFHPDVHNHSAEYLTKLKYYVDIYLERYGSYPYKKFAVVSNFFTTGFGMASYTLLDKNIIPYSFIIDASLGHEFVHNYWGNSVYIESSQGNWVEGLTTFEADYLYSLLESAEKGKAYRLSSLKDYENLVNEQNRFPISKFRSRNSPASSAIGYGKVMMVFLMLQNRIGSEAYIEGLQKVIQQMSYTEVNYDNLKAVFESTSGQDLDVFFKQWVYREDVPVFKDVQWEQSGSEVKVTLEQGNAAAYEINVPIRFSFEDGSQEDSVLAMNQLSQEFTKQFTKTVSRVELDPEFLLMRGLKLIENQPTIKLLTGQSQVSFYTLKSAPSFDPADSLLLSKALFSDTASISIKSLDAAQTFEGENLPAVIFLERSDLDSPMVADILSQDARVQWNAGAMQVVNGQDTHAIDVDKEYFVLALRYDNKPLLLIYRPQDKPYAALARRLPHYGKKSILGFDSQGSNILSEEWLIPQ